MGISGSRAGAQQLWYTGLVTPERVESSQTRERAGSWRQTLMLLPAEAVSSHPAIHMDATQLPAEHRSLNTLSGCPSYPFPVWSTQVHILLLPGIIRQRQRLSQTYRKYVGIMIVSKEIFLSFNRVKAFTLLLRKLSVNRMTDFAGEIYQLWVETLPAVIKSTGSGMMGLP